MLVSQSGGWSPKMPTWLGTRRNRMCTFTTSIRYGISYNARPHSGTNAKLNRLENNSGQRAVRAKRNCNDTYFDGVLSLNSLCILPANCWVVLVPSCVISLAYLQTHAQYTRLLSELNAKHTVSYPKQSSFHAHPTTRKRFGSGTH